MMVCMWSMFMAASVSAYRGWLMTQAQRCFFLQIQSYTIESTQI